MRPSFPIPIDSPESYVHREFLGQRDGLQAIPMKKKRIGISGRGIYTFSVHQLGQRDIGMNPNDILSPPVRHLSRTAIQPTSPSHVLRCLDAMRDEHVCVCAYVFPVWFGSPTQDLPWFSLL